MSILKYSRPCFNKAVVLFSCVEFCWGDTVLYLGEIAGASCAYCIRWIRRRCCSDYETLLNLLRLVLLCKRCLRRYIFAYGGECHN